MYEVYSEKWPMRRGICTVRLLAFAPPPSTESKQGIDFKPGVYNHKFRETCLKESTFNLIGVRLWTWFQPNCWGVIRKSFWNALEASGGRWWQYFYRTIYLWAPPDPSNLTYYILYYIMYLTLCKPFMVKFSLNSEISRPVFFNIDRIYSNLDI